MYSVFVVVVQCLCLINFAKSILYEGDNCELAYKEPGKCIKLSECPSAIELIRRRQDPQTCGFIKSMPIVCCPIMQAVTARLAEQKCKSFQVKIQSSSIQSQNNTEIVPVPVVPVPVVPVPVASVPVASVPVPNNTDGIYNQSDYADIPDSKLFVIGGIDSMPREFPHMVALGYTSGKNKLWLCGGTLVSEQFVLTAAHCLYSIEYGSIKWARLGDLNLASTTDLSDPQDYQILKTIPHSSYKPPSVYDDIALLQLDRPAIITSFVHPACLFIDENIPTKLIATGWGLTKLAGEKSDILQKVELDLFNDTECDNTFRDMANSRRLKNGIVHKQQFCAGGRTEEKDTCQGDSGGPLQIRTSDPSGTFFQVVGITSFGKSCGFINVPGVYTRVSFYVPWLESILWPKGE